jgi:glycosyltransferase involved in cell wall biosynthesis
MKFSVLLPTRNRLEYLRFAVESVRRQNFDNWELIISDNCSEDDVAGFVASLADPRILYHRTESFVPVTENWNNALEKSSGEWVIMLGDDDCLMQDYFAIVSRLIQRFGSPEFIYSSAKVFAYPGVVPDAPSGYVQDYGYASFLRGAKEPYVLGSREMHQLVRHSVNFRIRLGFNMQFATVSRSLINRVSADGPFFRSPFPDYFAMNAMLLKARMMLVCPYPLVTIGITKKSYGFFHYNRKESEGVEFLKSVPSRESAEKLGRVLLPGSNINNGWLFAMQTLSDVYGEEFKLRPNYRRYRFVQHFQTLRDYHVERAIAPEKVAQYRRQLVLWERIIYGIGEWLAFGGGRQVGVKIKTLVAFLWQRFFPDLRTSPTTFLPWFAEREEGRFRNIMEVFESIHPLDENRVARESHRGPV